MHYAISGRTDHAPTYRPTYVLPWRYTCVAAGRRLDYCYGTAAWRWWRAQMSTFSTAVVLVPEEALEECMINMVNGLGVGYMIC